MKPPPARRPSSLTLRFDTGRLPRLQEVLDALGYDPTTPPAHARFAARGDGARVVLYNSGKLVLQGKGAEALQNELAAFDLVPPPLSATEHRAAVGSDECGKGDFFGPLVVAAAYLDTERARTLLERGIADSKRLTDTRVLQLAKRIERACPHEVVSIGPRRYNELYERFGNLNHLLAWAHGRAIERVLERTGGSRVVIDRFARDDSVIRRALGPRGRTVEIVQIPRAESAEPAVAAASILARARFVRDLERLSERAGMTLPKGAARQVERAGVELVRRLGPEALGEYAKLHFRTAERVRAAARGR